ncbi:MAG: NAD(P)/FAD-dependent oxidoreductase [bacterium]
MSTTVVIGAGPAGLTAAYELGRLGLDAIVLERDHTVGGLSRTVEHRGYRFDIGGHRFYTKVPLVQELWEELLGPDLVTRERLSRIYYRGRYFDYPLKPINALSGLGPMEALRIVLSYTKTQLFPLPDERTFEDWVVNRFGRRLFEIFFKSYTEKVWGVPCTQIAADWAAQRIQDLSLATALRGALLGGASRSGASATTLIERFHYPRLGPGMLWERCRERVAAHGISTILGARVTRIHHDGRRVLAVHHHDSDGFAHVTAGTHFVSSMPLRTLVRRLEPAPPAEVRAAAERLGYRDFLTVVLVVAREQVFPDQWIYIHEPEVRVGRVQNFKNWSPWMVPDASRSSLGLEYFVQQGDSLWSASDDELIALAVRESATLGLVDPREVVDAVVVRVEKAYPIYDPQYRSAVELVRAYLATLGNLQTIGRNGLHRYNNQDHSMLTGVLAARNVAGERHDVWSVNVEPVHLEEASGSAMRDLGTGRAAPRILA